MMFLSGFRPESALFFNLKAVCFKFGISVGNYLAISCLNSDNGPEENQSDCPVPSKQAGVLVLFDETRFLMIDTLAVLVFRSR